MGNTCCAAGEVDKANVDGFSRTSSQAQIVKGNAYTTDHIFMIVRLQKRVRKV